MEFIINTTKRKPSGKKLQVGIIGMGKMGKIRYEEALRHPLMDVVAICDIWQGMEEEYPNTAIFSDYNDLIQYPGLDVVIVCTFNHIAPDVVKKALSAGKHVFCEKPPARTVEELNEVIAVEKAHPELVLMYGFNHRKHYSIMEAKQMVDSGRLGKLLWMRGVYGKAGGLHFTDSWRNDKELSGGGILIDQGIHMVDLFLYFADEFTQVQSAIVNAYWDVPVEDNAFAILRNDKNQTALLHSSATQWKHTFSLEIGLENGYINLNGILSSTRSYGDETLTYARRQFENETHSFGKPREETIYFGSDDSWKLEFVDFVDAILEDKPLSTGSSSDALKALSLVHKIYANSSH